MKKNLLLLAACGGMLLAATTLRLRRQSLSTKASILTLPTSSAKTITTTPGVKTGSSKSVPAHSFPSLKTPASKATGLTRSLRSITSVSATGGVPISASA